MRRIVAWFRRPRVSSPDETATERTPAREPTGEELIDEEPFDPAAAVEVPIGDEIDLHGFRPEDTRAVVEAFLVEAEKQGIREVRVVHGKGTGVQARIVRGLLDRHPRVASYGQAPANRGGWGATVVRLRGRDDGAET
jgi:DNA-nicking Smr family endonuclease